MPNHRAPITCSLFFLGTSHHRENHRGRYDIINQFYKNATEDDTHAKRLFDGPGGTADEALHAQQHPTPGHYKVDFFDNRKVLSEQMESANRILKKLKIAGGLVLGDGIENNIIESIQYLYYLESQGKMPERVNLYGFSRGGYTAIVLAHVIEEIFPEIQVNLCLVDPVPGPNAINRDISTVIPRNVEHMTSVLMLDEVTPGFTPLDQEHLILANPMKTSVNYQVYHGTHGAACYSKEKQSKTHATPTLAHDTLYKFARRYGTKLHQNKMPPRGYKKSNSEYYEKESAYQYGMSNTERLIEYEKMCYFQDNYRSNKEKIFPGRTMRNKVADEYYVRDPDMFVNQEHRELFAMEFPAVFNYFFKKEANKKYTLRDVEKELSKMYDSKNNPKKDIFNIATYKKLQRRFYFDYDHTSGQYILPTPSGYPDSEVFPVTLEKPAVHDEESYFNNVLNALINQFEVLLDTNNVQTKISYSLPGFKAAYKILSKLKSTLSEYKNTNYSDVEATQKMRKQLLNIYLDIKKIKSLDILELNKSMMVMQIEIAIGSDILQHEVITNFGNIFGKSKRRMPWTNRGASHTPELNKVRAKISASLKNIITIKNTPKTSEEEKSRMIRIELESLIDELNNILNTPELKRNLSLSKKTKMFIRNIEKAIHKRSYAHTMRHDYAIIEKKHSFLASVGRLINFTNFGKNMEASHMEVAMIAKISKHRCTSLINNNQGNNQTKLSSIVYQNSQKLSKARGQIKYFEDLDKVIGKHKHALSAMHHPVFNGKKPQRK